MTHRCYLVHAGSFKLGLSVVVQSPGRSIMVTSNRAPEEWAEILGNPLLANAGLDRLLDRSHVVEITGRSYRLARRGQPEEVPQTQSASV